MKKILLFIGALMMTTCWFGSCDDNEDFSNPHILTNDELEEMERQRIQDSINRARINADIILEYNITLNEGEAYEGQELVVDWQPIADCFGTTVEALWAALDDGDAKALFIQGSNHADYAGGTTANGVLGYWCNKEGDVCSWGSEAAVYEEWWSEDGAFFVGQMPGTLVAGDVVTIMPGVKYQDKRAVIKMTFTIKGIEDNETAPAGDPETIETDVVMEKDFSEDYASVEFDVKETLRQAFKMTTKQICDAIGAGDLKVYLNEESAEDPAYTADVPGYWINSEGQVTGWGNDSYIWLSLGNNAANGLLYLYGGNHPAFGRDGAEIHTKFIVTCNGGKAIFNVTYKVNAFAYEDPEVKPGTTPADVTKDLALEKVWSDDYAAVAIDVKEDVCNAFNLTTFELFNALNNGEINVFMNEAAEAAEYTGELGQYWIDAEANPVGWGDGYLFTGLAVDYEACEAYIVMGNHPDNCPKAHSCAYKLIITDGTTTVTYNVTANVSAE